LGPYESAESFDKPLGKCPNCGGPVKDYNAETVIINVATLKQMKEGGSPIQYLYICRYCGGKFFAPREEPPQK
jgi:rRNA maturation endonuclease Nob1